MEIKLRAIYTQWNNEKLLAEFRKKDEYTITALNVMQQLLSERGLLDEVDKQIERDRIESIRQQQISEEKLANKTKTYYKDNLGTSNSVNYAEQQKDADGVFFEASFTENNKNYFYSNLLIAAGISLFIIAVATYFTDNDWYLTALCFLIAGIPILIAGLWFRKRSSVTIKLYEKAAATYFEIIGGTQYFKLKYPFDYYHYQGSQTTSLEAIEIGKKPILFLLVHSQADNVNIIMEEHFAGISKQGPPDWPRQATVPNSPFNVNYLGLTSDANLLKLKMILDGLKK
jgi:hypothetical protein